MSAGAEFTFEREHGAQTVAVATVDSWVQRIDVYTIKIDEYLDYVAACLDDMNTEAARALLTCVGGYVDDLQLVARDIERLER